MSINKSCDTLYGVILQPYVGVLVSSIIFLSFQLILERYILPYSFKCLQQCHNTLFAKKETGNNNLEASLIALDPTNAVLIKNMYPSERTKEYMISASQQESYDRVKGDIINSYRFSVLQVGFTIISSIIVIIDVENDGGSSWDRYVNVGGRWLNSTILSLLYVIIINFINEFKVITSGDYINRIQVGDTVCKVIPKSAENPERTEILATVVKINTPKEPENYKETTYEVSLHSSENDIQVWTLEECHNVIVSVIMPIIASYGVFYYVLIQLLVLVMLPWIVTHIIVGKYNALNHLS